MKVIKSESTELTEALIDTIAGEMINIETSTLYFVDGKLIDKPVDGYPTSVICTSIKDVVKSSVGFLYVGSDVDCGEIVDCITIAIEKMSKLLPTDPLVSKYQTSVSGIHTNLKVKPTRIDESAVQKRNIVVGFSSSYLTARFTWIINNINCFDYTISSANLIESFHRHVCSVFWDTDNISTYAHNEITLGFSKEKLRGTVQIVAEKKIKLSKYGHPLQIELSETWSDRSLAPTYYNVNREIRALTYEQWAAIYKEVYLVNDTSAELVCNECRSKLWGSNYFLMDREVEVAPAILCPMCMHTNDTISSKYSHVFRVEWNVTAADMIDHLCVSAAKRDIYFNIMKSIDIIRLYDINCRLIGDKYMAFDSNDGYIYTRYVHDVRTRDRNIITIKLIQ